MKDHFFFLMAGLILVLTGCAGGAQGGGRDVKMVVTAYCSCGKCCAWKRSLMGVPVHTSGGQKGKRKAVGICADGSRIKKGVAAADTEYYAFGTRMTIPGYGKVVVRDRGDAIKGAGRLDVYFPRHGDALKWGKQTLTVTVYDEN